MNFKKCQIYQVMYSGWGWLFKLDQKGGWAGGIGTRPWANVDTATLRSLCKFIPQ